MSIASLTLVVTTKIAQTFKFHPVADQPNFTILRASAFSLSTVQMQFFLKKNGKLFMTQINVA
jgi:hypothetical protein